MIPNPLKFIRLLSPSKQMKPDLTEIIDASMEPTNQSAGTTFYLSITKGGKVLYQYNKSGREIESLATLCLEQVPPYHKWFFHTVGTRSFGFLIYKNCIYFAIVQPTLGSIALQDFLSRVCEVHLNVPNKSLKKELARIVAHFLNSVQTKPNNEGNIVNNETIGEEIEINGEHVEVRILDIPGNGQTRELFGLEKKSRGAVWWKHAKIVATVDFIVCLVLFVIWLGVCKGFDCVRK